MQYHIFYRTVGFHVVILIWFIKCSETVTTSSECESLQINQGCCDGYIRDQETRKCTNCMVGYIGPNCTIRCPYPLYGIKCQKQCNCSNDTCNVSTGCTTLTTDDKTSSVTTISTDFKENGTFRSMENHTLKFSGDETSFLPTKFDESTTSNTTDNSTSKFPGTYNRILILLIKGFGGVDIVLICTYSVMLMIDRYNQRSAFQTNYRRGYAQRSNSMYENIEIGFLPND